MLDGGESESNPLPSTKCNSPPSAPPPPPPSLSSAVAASEMETDFSITPPPTAAATASPPLLLLQGNPYSQIETAMDGSCPSVSGMTADADTQVVNGSSGDSFTRAPGGSVASAATAQYGSSSSADPSTTTTTGHHPHPGDGGGDCDLNGVSAAVSSGVVGGLPIYHPQQPGPPGVMTCAAAYVSPSGPVSASVGGRGVALGLQQHPTRGLMYGPGAAAELHHTMSAIGRSAAAAGHHQIPLYAQAAAAVAARQHLEFHQSAAAAAAMGSGTLQSPAPGLLLGVGPVNHLGVLGATGVGGAQAGAGNIGEVTLEEAEAEIGRCHLHRKPQLTCKFCRKYKRAVHQHARLAQQQAQRNPQEDPRHCLPMTNVNTFGINNLLRENILSSEYFKSLYVLKTFEEIVDEIYSYADHAEPYCAGHSRAPSTLFCCLYKLFQLKLTARQMHTLLNHPDSPFIRVAGFLYLRYTLPPDQLWKWYQPYVLDDEQFSPSCDKSRLLTTIGEFVEGLITDDKYFATVLPRLPVKIKTLYGTQLITMDEHRKRKTHNKQILHRFVPEAEVTACTNGDWLDGEIIECSEVHSGRAACLIKFEDDTEEEIDLALIILKEDKPKDGATTAATEGGATAGGETASTGTHTSQYRHHRERKASRHHSQPPGRYRYDRKVSPQGDGTHGGVALSPPRVQRYESPSRHYTDAQGSSDGEAGAAPECQNRSLPANTTDVSNRSGTAAAEDSVGKGSPERYRQGGASSETVDAIHQQHGCSSRGAAVGSSGSSRRHRHRDAAADHHHRSSSRPLQRTRHSTSDGGGRHHHQYHQDSRRRDDRASYRREDSADYSNRRRKAAAAGVRSPSCVSGKHHVDGRTRSRSLRSNESVRRSRSRRHRRDEIYGGEPEDRDEDDRHHHSRSYHVNAHHDGRGKHRVDSQRYRTRNSDSGSDVESEEEFDRELRSKKDRGGSASRRRPRTASHVTSRYYRRHHHEESRHHDRRKSSRDYQTRRSRRDRSRSEGDYVSDGGAARKEGSDRRRRDEDAQGVSDEVERNRQDLPPGDGDEKDGQTFSSRATRDHLPGREGVRSASPKAQQAVGKPTTSAPKTQDELLMEYRRRESAKAVAFGKDYARRPTSYKSCLSMRGEATASRKVSSVGNAQSSGATSGTSKALSGHVSSTHTGPGGGGRRTNYSQQLSSSRGMTTTADSEDSSEKKKRMATIMEKYTKLPNSLDDGGEGVKRRALMEGPAVLRLG